MQDKRNEQPQKVKWYQKLYAVPTLFLIYTLWSIDRFLHIFLPHAPHKNVREWVLDENSLKTTIARILIFCVPILIYKIVFCWL